MNPYHAFIDARERSYMTEDEKLEKRNLEIIMSYRTSSVPENMTTKSETVNIEPKKNNKKYKY